MADPTYRLTLSGLTRAAAEQASSLLEDEFSGLAAQAVAVLDEDDGSGLWRVEADYSEQPSLDGVTSALEAAGLDPPDIGIEAVADRDWVAASQSALAPVHAGRFWVFGSGHPSAPPGLIPIRIEAAQAFGTGHHETTAGCLKALSLAVRTNRYHSVLDFGCGSGLLAIAAARLLKIPVLAADNDPVAVAIAAENARLNAAAPLVRVIEASRPHGRAFNAHGPFDLVMANILAGPLIELAQPLVRAAAPGATIILSGLLAPQAQAVMARYRALGCAPRARLVEKNWATLTLVAPGPPGGRRM